MKMHKPARFFSQRRVFLSLVVGMAGSGGALGVAGCGSMMVNATEAQVRFVDTSVDAPALDVYLNGTGAAYNLGFATFSSYVPVSAGSYLLNANRASTTQALVSSRAALAAGHQYTAVVSNRLGELQQHVYNDAIPAPAPGILTVRVLNEAQGAPLDVYLVANAALLSSVAPLVTGVSYGANGGYVRLPAGGTYAVYAGPAGSAPLANGVLKVSGASVSGGSGAARTLILTEGAARDGKGLYGIVLDDADGQ